MSIVLSHSQVVSFLSAAIAECGLLLSSDSLALRDLGGALAAELGASFPLPTRSSTEAPGGFVKVEAVSGDCTPMEVEVR